MKRLKEFFKSKSEKPVVRTGPRVYRQMAVSPEAHAKISAIADKNDDSIIDTVDKLVGVL